MASPKLSRHRQSKVGFFYIVTTVTDRRTPLFKDDRAARMVIHEINSCEYEGLVDSHAWVVMPDHIHWLVELRSGSLKACLQRFKSRSARAIHSMLGTSGAIWQPGFYDHYLRSDEDLRAQARYIALNPVRAGIVAKTEDYPHQWSRWIRNCAGL
ncbi:transposase [Luteimonas gilva]|uniref:Transposase n=1 Tax=Luteimonas gilva TaxID=2572684 RepID=A0A4U5JPS5_9GAMM|nr:transposase [Luteimonas gilva]TKR30398.1 transposase [Luteimonas gilva]